MLDIVTGAFSHTGKYITERLLEAGRRVQTLTGHPERSHPFGDRVQAFPFNFDHPLELVRSLEGATTLYNTYWIRFIHKESTFDRAVENSRVLFEAAREAGIQRVVHLSIMNPSLDSPFPYFHGKALVEKALMESGLSYAIFRPSVIFGPEDVLINNIAWMLRRFPVFAIPGSGDYGVQPVFAEDVADLCVHAGKSHENIALDAAGPEIYSFKDLVRLIARTVGKRARMIQVPPSIALAGSKLIGALVRDVVMTKEELDGLMAGLCVSHEPPTAPTHLSDWLARNASSVGARWASELRRHFDPSGEQSRRAAQPGDPKRH